jgi:hypothetical protein
MALTNAEKQRRWRERNQVVLTERGEDIAEKLIDMDDQAKVRKIFRLVGNHLKAPNRSAFERAVDLGRLSRPRDENGKLLGKAEAAMVWERDLKQTRADMQELNRAFMASEISQEEYDGATKGHWPARLPRPEVA